MEPLVHPMAALAGAAEAHRSNIKPDAGPSEHPSFSPWHYRYRNVLERLFNKFKHSEPAQVALKARCQLSRAHQACGLPKSGCRLPVGDLVCPLAWVPRRSTPSLYPGSQRRSELGSDLGLICR